MAGSVPPLTGRIGSIAATAEGREYLAVVLLNGLGGPIVANGQRYSAGMPPFRYLKDAEIAAILTWLAAQNTPAPSPVITEQEIATARAHRISSGKVAEMREQLDKIHPLP